MELRSIFAKLRSIAVEALPVCSLYTLAKAGIRNYFFIENEIPSSFLITRDQIEVMARHLVERKVVIGGVEGELKQKTRRLFDKIVIDTLRSSLNTIDRLNAKHGTSVQFRISTEEDLLYSTVEGDQPVILFSMPRFQADVKKEENPGVLQEVEATFQKFILGHNAFLALKFSHLVHRDASSLRSIRIAAAAVNLIPWMTALSFPMSWGAYLQYAFSRSFGIAAISQAVQSLFAVKFHIRATEEVLSSFKDD